MELLAFDGLAGARVEDEHAASVGRAVNCLVQRAPAGLLHDLALLGSQEFARHVDFFALGGPKTPKPQSVPNNANLIEHNVIQCFMS